MTRILLCAALAATLCVMAAPAATALEFVPPPEPTAPCPRWPPGSGGGIEEIVHDTLHDATNTACNGVDNGNVLVGIAYRFAMAEVAIVVGILAPVVDGTQDNYCTAMYGEPNPPNKPECKDLVVKVDPVTA